MYKYSLGKNGTILRDGHTMMSFDIVQDLNRKPFLETQNLQAIANEVCRDIPEGFILSLDMEKGSGFLSMIKDDEPVDLSDIDHDQTLINQLKWALSVAQDMVR